MNGIVNLDKPAGITSAAAVGRVKRLLPRGTKIGHAGTLDPFATGVLLLLIGKATKSCEQLMGEPKQYETTIKFGATTPTDDLESPETPYINPSPPPDRTTIEATLPRFIGAIAQRPPAFSALKLAGRPAYQLARKGETVELQPRIVHVHIIDLLDYEWPHLKLRIDCGRGTYIRAISRDLGEALGVGGFLTQLRRTRIGQFNIAGAVSIEKLATEGIASHLHEIP